MGLVPFDSTEQIQTKTKKQKSLCPVEVPALGVSFFPLLSRCSEHCCGKGVVVKVATESQGPSPKKPCLGSFVFEVCPGRQEKNYMCL